MPLWYDPALEQDPTMDAPRLTGATILQTLREHRHLLEHYSVREFALFGSYATGRQHAQSDIDLYVEFDRPTFDNFIGLSDTLEQLLGKKVDILTPAGLDSIRIPEIAANIRKTLAYG